MPAFFNKILKTSYFFNSVGSKVQKSLFKRLFFYILFYVNGFFFFSQIFPLYMDFLLKYANKFAPRLNVSEIKWSKVVHTLAHCLMIKILSKRLKQNNALLIGNLNLLRKCVKNA